MKECVPERDTLDKTELANSVDNRIEAAKRWSHVFKCYTGFLKKEHGFAELCYQCDEWITDANKWQEHCEDHLARIDTLPVQFHQIKYRYTPATICQCIYCLFNTKLPATERWKQFKDKNYWKWHTGEHIQEEENKEYARDRDESKAIPCPDPRCDLLFESGDWLRYHLQDAHCIEADSKPGVVLDESDNKLKVEFLNETIDTLPSRFAERPAPEYRPKGKTKLETPQMHRGDSPPALPPTKLVDEVMMKRKSGRLRKLPRVPLTTIGNKVIGRKQGQPKKYYANSPTAARLPTASIDGAVRKGKRGRPRKYSTESSTASFSSKIPTSLGEELERGNRRTRYPSSFSALSSRSGSAQSQDGQAIKSKTEILALDDNFSGKSSYESSDSSADECSDEAYSPSEDDSQNKTVNKRIKRRKVWESYSTACSLMTASTASSDLLRASSPTTLRMHEIHAPRTKSRHLSKPTATTPQVVIYV
jgi:hypothetical protein